LPSVGNTMEEVTDSISYRYCFPLLQSFTISYLFKASSPLSLGEKQRGVADTGNQDFCKTLYRLSLVVPSKKAKAWDIDHEGSQRLTDLVYLKLRSFASSSLNIYFHQSAQNDKFVPKETKRPKDGIYI